MKNRPSDPKISWYADFGDNFDAWTRVFSGDFTRETPKSQCILPCKLHCFTVYFIRQNGLFNSGLQGKITGKKHELGPRPPSPPTHLLARSSGVAFLKAGMTPIQKTPSPSFWRAHTKFCEPMQQKVQGFFFIYNIYGTQSKGGGDPY